MPDILPAGTAAAMNTQNPAKAPGKSVAERQRIPMSLPVQSLEVPEKPGFHRHWFRSDPARIARAQQAGYTFVAADDVDINNQDIGGSSVASGNTDMGSRVSVVSGDDLGNDGQPGRLILMEIPEEWWKESEAILEQKNEQIADAIRGGTLATGPRENPMDAGLRYIKQGDNLFTKPSNRK